MSIDVVNIGLAFLEGFALIISPCILPILPLVLTGSLTGSKARPLGLIVGFILTFTLFTLFSKILIDHLHINANALRYASYTILTFLGIMMMSNYLTEKFNLFTKQIIHVNQASNRNFIQNNFWSGVLFGALIAIIWTPCAGPILAAVIVQAIIQKTTINSFFVVLFFALGVSIPMLLIAFLGRGFMQHFNFFRGKSSLFRKLLGALIILGVIFSIYSTDLALFSARLKFNNFVTSEVSHKIYPAPPLAGIVAWINSPPLQLSNLKGKVVLIDFWAYSCINCIRTQPYLNEWYKKYKDKGFIVIGVHSPEFPFEAELTNVRKAVQLFGIQYPVALDNNFMTWENYHNIYWPSHYLINKNGDVIYRQFGEGNFEEIEKNIRLALGLKPENGKYVTREKVSTDQTPETYLGFQRSENYANEAAGKINAPEQYIYPSKLALNEWSLKGKWIISLHNITTAEKGASIKLHFKAKKVYAVMGNRDKPVKIDLLLNGKVLPKSSLVVDTHQLYILLSLSEKEEGIIEMTAQSPGLEVYTFTFGG